MNDLLRHLSELMAWESITVAARSTAWAVFARLGAGIVGSSPTQGTHICVCLYSVFMLVLCLISGFTTGWPPSKESYRLCKKDYETEEEGRAQQTAVEPLINEWMNEHGLRYCLLNIVKYNLCTLQLAHYKFWE
jgi:hypothetical protein